MRCPKAVCCSFFPSASTFSHFPNLPFAFASPCLPLKAYRIIRMLSHYHPSVTVIIKLILNILSSDHHKNMYLTNECPCQLRSLSITKAFKFSYHTSKQNLLHGSSWRLHLFISVEARDWEQCYPLHAPLISHCPLCSSRVSVAKI